MRYVLQTLVLLGFGAYFLRYGYDLAGGVCVIAALFSVIVPSGGEKEQE